MPRKSEKTEPKKTQRGRQLPKTIEKPKTPPKYKKTVEPAKARWTARVKFKDAPSYVIYFDEFDELGDIMEAGPDWTGIEAITIYYQGWEE